MTQPHQPRTGSDNRRDFLKESLALAALPVGLVGGLAESALAQTKSSDTLRLGVLGCGQRGLQIAKECLKSSIARVELHGLADLFPDRIQQVYRALNGSFADQLRIESSQRYLGLQSAQQLAASDVQMVVVSAAPGFRAEHLQTLTSAGKHVYVERPWATNIRDSIQIAEVAAAAETRRLVVHAGLQHRSQPLMQTAVEMLQQGVIGRLVYANVVRTQPKASANASLQPRAREPQALRHWQQNLQAGGHPFVQQLTGGLDLMNWVVGRAPMSAAAGEVSSTRSDPNSNMAVQYHYADGPTVDCRLVSDGTSHGWSVRIQGTRGWADLSRGKIFDQQNELLWSGGAMSMSSQASIDHWLGTVSRVGLQSTLSLSQTSQIEAAVQSTQTALLGQAALDSSRRILWQDVFDSANC